MLSALEFSHELSFYKKRHFADAQRNPILMWHFLQDDKGTAPLKEFCTGGGGLSLQNKTKDQYFYSSQQIGSSSCSERPCTAMGTLSRWLMYLAAGTYVKSDSSPPPHQPLLPQSGRSHLHICFGTTSCSRRIFLWQPELICWALMSLAYQPIAWNQSGICDESVFGQIHIW